MSDVDRWYRGTKLERSASLARGPVLSPEEARQGVISGRVLLILTVSMALVVMAFAIIYVAQS